MKVRKYEPNDSVGVKNLILTILEKEYPFDRFAYKDTDINDISGTYGGEGNAFFVIDKNGKIVGTVGVKKETDTSALIRRLFVGQRYRRKGCGTDLLKAAIEFCKTQHYREAIFRATDKMAQVMSLCKKMGFSEKENLEVSGFRIHTFTLTL
jgi:putative acetyltransferase